jgi:hypothetical protein
LSLKKNSNKKNDFFIENCDNYRKMTIDDSDLIKNMPVFVQAKEWLVVVTSYGYKKLTKLDAWRLNDEGVARATRIQDSVRNKHRAMGSAVRTGQWRDFDAVEVHGETASMFLDLYTEITIKHVFGPTVESPTVEATQEEPTPEAAWVLNKFKRVCNSFRLGCDCVHVETGKTCSFAHSVEQLRTGVVACNFGATCYRWKGHDRPCECLHPGETVDQLVDRLGLMTELPMVTVAPKEVVMPTAVTQPKVVTVKGAYAIECEELKNALFAQHAKVDELTKRNANLEHQLEGFRLLLVRQERDLRDAGLIQSTQHLKINVPVCID